MTLVILASSGLLRAGDYEVPPLSEYVDDGFGADLSFYGFLNATYQGLGHGGGAMFAWPLMPAGFLGSGVYRDALHIEGGLDFCRWVYELDDDYGSKMVFAPGLGLRYAVYLNDWLAPLASLRLGLGLPVTSGVDDSASFFWSATAGLLMDLSDILSFRIELGWGRYSDVLRLGVLIRL